MAHRGRKTASQPARQEVTLKPDQKADRKKDKSLSTPSCDVWDYYMGQDLKARFIKRHSKADQKPVCEPQVWDYDSDDTIPYGPDMNENMKALVIKQMNEALDRLSSDSVPDDSTSDLSCVERGNESNDKNECHLDIEVDPVPDPDRNPSSINHDFHNSVGNANVHSMDDEIAMDITIEPPNDQSNGIMDALNMEFINNLKSGDEFNGKMNQDEFYEFINLMNDEKISDIDDFMNHNLQQSQLEHKNSSVDCDTRHTFHPFHLL